MDERDGNMRNDIYEMSKDPAKKTERSKLLAGRQVTYPAKLETGKWYALAVETVGDTMRVTLDGKPAGFLKSSGIGHATKSKIELGVGGKDGFFDKVRARLVGAQGYITKPVEPQELVKAVEGYCRPAPPL